jgi:hypothetical protein
MLPALAIGATRVFSLIYYHDVPQVVAPIPPFLPAVCSLHELAWTLLRVASGRRCLVEIPGAQSRAVSPLLFLAFLSAPAFSNTATISGLSLYRTDPLPSDLSFVGQGSIPLRRAGSSTPCCMAGVTRARGFPIGEDVIFFLDRHHASLRPS